VEGSILGTCFCGRCIACVFACSVLFICGVFSNAASKVGSSLLCDVSQRRPVVSHRRFGTAH
jgi:hypothetical protein